MLTKYDPNSEARDVLDEIEDMSRCNATDGTTREVNIRPSTGETITVTLPWVAALAVRPSFVGHQAQWVAQRLFAKYTAPTGSELRRRRARAKPQNQKRWTLPTYDGDRPVDPTDREYRQEIERGEMWSRLETRDAIFEVLTKRKVSLYDAKTLGESFGSVVRATHRAVHRALVGGPVVDSLGKECKWCEGSSR